MPNFNQCDITTKSCA